jgi:S-adenosylmethionine/arginine decarboxylase-like enzyme
MLLPPSKRGSIYADGRMLIMAMRNVLQKSEEAVAWGVLTSLDIYGCDPQIIRDTDKIRQFVIELCKLIDMKRFGECMVVHFGEDEHIAGYSMVQLIETSLISGHFANKTNAAYIDVFSCKPYDSQQVARFAKKYFHGESITVHVTPRH